MTSFKQTATGDIYYNTATNTTELVSGAEETAQNCASALQFFLGEWFLDTRLGMPYYEKILGEKPRISVLKALYRKYLMLVNGMLAINDLFIDYDGLSRTLLVYFVGKSAEGSFVFDRELII